MRNTPTGEATTRARPEGAPPLPPVSPQRHAQEHQGRCLEWTACMLVAGKAEVRTM